MNTAMMTMNTDMSAFMGLSPKNDLENRLIRAESVFMAYVERLSLVYGDARDTDISGLHQLRQLRQLRQLHQLGQVRRRPNSRSGNIYLDYLLIKLQSHRIFHWPGSKSTGHCKRAGEFRKRFRDMLYQCQIHSSISRANHIQIFPKPLLNIPYLLLSILANSPFLT